MKGSLKRRPETVMEQENSLLQDELSAAESALRKQKAARKQAPLLGETNPPPGLRTGFERAPEGPERPPPSPFEVPAGMKSFLAIHHPSQASLHPQHRGQWQTLPQTNSRSLLRSKQPLLLAQETCQDPRRTPTLLGSSKHRQLCSNSSKGKS